MLFNSYFFIFVFLPIALSIYFILNASKFAIASRIWLALASITFYGWWNVYFVPIILLSIIFNYALGLSLNDQKLRGNKKCVLVVGLIFNLGLLMYFKYCNFFILNINAVVHSQLPILDVALPLGISFFTFTQIAFLVDVYKGVVKEINFLNYLLFVTFFPHLIAGPILHHKDMMPQFDLRENKFLNSENIRAGLFLFSIGLFKKLVLGDTFAQWANYGFDQVRNLTSIEAWMVAFSYTFQLYFDFSGYTDMALGIALLFNIKLPINFNSPYKSCDIQEFWKKWHMTLSRFLMEYVYIPMGGNRVGALRTYGNILAVFIVGGIWHGAGWLFVLWGMVHGIANVICRVWKTANVHLHPYVAWFITFNFVNLTWVLFRSKNVAIAQNMFFSMFNVFSIDFNALKASPIIFKDHWFEFGWQHQGSPINALTLFFILAGFIITILGRNSNEMAQKVRVGGFKWAVISGAFLAISLMFISKKSVFLYCQF